MQSSLGPAEVNIGDRESASIATGSWRAARSSLLLRSRKNLLQTHQRIVIFTVAIDLRFAAAWVQRFLRDFQSLHFTKNSELAQSFDRAGLIGKFTVGRTV